MTNETPPPGYPDNGTLGAARVPSERQLVVIARPEAGLRVTREGVTSTEGADVASLAELLAYEGATLRPLFGESEERLKAEAESLRTASSDEVPDLSVYYLVVAPDQQLDQLAERLSELDVVKAAYVKPAPELPVFYDEGVAVVPREEAPPLVTPDFTARQGYLDAAPGGIDVRFAWTQVGGQGLGVRIIDIEGGWNFGHEDLRSSQHGGVVGGTPTLNRVWRQHGTNVLGVYSGDSNAFGITGMCPQAIVHAISAFGLGTPAAIKRAANFLNKGDIILIELQRTGPNNNYIPIEWWPDEFDVIRFATAVKKVIVVEAAANGGENLDAPIYNTPAPGFPPDWTNPFNRANRDSGAIVVGAGAPPPGTHGRDRGPDRSRLRFSDFGDMDAQGWGAEVTTTGAFPTMAVGDLQDGPDEDFWYTDIFNGTSSASATLAGTLGCLQGARMRKTDPDGPGFSPLGPAEMRTLLRQTGSPQQDYPGTPDPPRPSTQRIGNRPDLRQLIPLVLI